MACWGHVPPSEPWPVPKIVDYDEKQMYKNPDSTYSVTSAV